MFDLEKKISKDRKLVKKIKSFLKILKYNPEHWIRFVTQINCKKLIKDKCFNLEKYNVLEISGGEYWKENLNVNKYRSLNYPDFDICLNKTEEKYDLIIADNIWEHLKYPYRATQNVFEMLNENGFFLIIVPFLVRVHNVPIDCTRWTKDGLMHFLYENGFKYENIITDSWGNIDCVKSNLRNDDKWSRVGFFSSLKNDEKFPVQVWALAKK